MRIMVRMEKEWVQVRARKEAEKLIVSEQVLKKRQQTTQKRFIATRLQHCGW